MTNLEKKTKNNKKKTLKTLAIITGSILLVTTSLFLGHYVFGGMEKSKEKFNYIMKKQGYFVSSNLVLSPEYYDIPACKKLFLHEINPEDIHSKFDTLHPKNLYPVIRRCRVWLPMNGPWPKEYTKSDKRGYKYIDLEAMRKDGNKPIPLSNHH